MIQNKINNNYRIKLVDRLSYLFISITMATVLCLYIAQPTDRFLILMEDDSFYYFEICRNIVQHGMVSFDQLHLTNGFHPLWMIVLIPIFTIFNSYPDLPIRVIAVIQIAMLTAVFIICYRMTGRYLGRGIGIIGILLALYPGFSRIVICGMETGLSVFLLSVLMLVLMESDALSKPHFLSTRKIWWIGFLISMLLLARLDAILFIGLIFFVMLDSCMKHWTLIRPRILPLFAGLTIPSLLLCSSYLIWNMSQFGILTPISGMIKMDYLRPHIEIGWFLVLIKPIMFEYGFALVISIIGIASCCTGFGKRVATSTYRRIVLIISSGYIIQILHLSVFSSWRAMWVWYFYLSIMVILFVTPFIFRISLEILGYGKKFNFSKIPRFIIVVSAILLITISLAGHSIYILKYLIHPNHMYFQNLKAADYVRENSNPESIFAMGDLAGLFGYYCDRRVIQLEGLVNNLDYQDVLEEDILEEYLQSNNVEYLVCYAENDPLVISGDYSEFHRIEPSHSSYHGPRDTILVYRENEVYRNTWNRRGIENKTEFAYIIWKLNIH